MVIEKKIPAIREVKSLISEEWLDDPTVQHWFKQIGKSGKERTLKNYRWEFPKFLEFVQVSPSEIVKQRLEQLATTDPTKKRFWENKWVEYKHHLEAQDYRKGTIQSYLRTIESFFTHNNVNLNLTKIDRKIEPSTKEKVIKEWVPSNEDIRVLYRMAQNARDRAILLTLYGSGFSERDVAELKIEYFDFYDEKGNWNVPADADLYIGKLREKSNVLQQTCLSHEALDEIKIMLQSRGFPTEGYLFVSFRDEKLGVRFINDAMKNIVEKAFNRKVKKWKTKNLRDSYKNALVRAKLSQEVVDAMFGHKRRGAKANYQLTEETIKAMYAEAFKFLTINGYGKTDRKLEELEKKMAEDKKALEDKMNEDKDALMEIIKDQQQKIADMEDKFHLELAQKVEIIFRTIKEFQKEEGIEIESYKNGEEPLEDPELMKQMEKKLKEEKE
jgi:site-specific recombinase XerD